MDIAPIQAALAPGAETSSTAATPADGGFAAVLTAIQGLLDSGPPGTAAPPGIAPAVQEAASLEPIAHSQTPDLAPQQDPAPTAAQDSAGAQAASALMASLVTQAPAPVTPLPVPQAPDKVAAPVAPLVTRQAAPAATPAKAEPAPAPQQGIDLSELPVAKDLGLKKVEATVEPVEQHGVSNVVLTDPVAPQQHPMATVVSSDPVKPLAHPMASITLTDPIAPNAHPMATVVLNDPAGKGKPSGGPVMLDAKPDAPKRPEGPKIELEATPVPSSGDDSSSSASAGDTESGSKQGSTNNPAPVAPAGARAAVVQKAEVAAPAIDRSHLVRQVADRIELMAAAKPRQGVVVHLEPAGLGSLTLVVKRTSTLIDAQITTSNDQVRDALTQSRPQLASALGSRGLSLGQMSVASASSDTASSRQGGAQANGQERPSGNPRQAPPREQDSHPSRDVAAMRRLARQIGGVDVWI